MSTMTIAFAGKSRNVHTMAGIFSLENRHLAGKSPLLVLDMLVNFGDILPETKAQGILISPSLHMVILFKLNKKGALDGGPQCQI